MYITHKYICVYECILTYVHFYMCLYNFIRKRMYQQIYSGIYILSTKQKIDFEKVVYKQRMDYSFNLMYQFSISCLCHPTKKLINNN